MSETQTEVTEIVDAAELMSTMPHRPKREQTLKTVMDKWPGHITVANDRASFSGCRIIEFQTNGTVAGLEVDDAAVYYDQVYYGQLNNDDAAKVGWGPADYMNLYFSHRANLLCIDWKPTETGILCIVTTQLDDEDLEEFQEAQVRVNLEMRDWRERKAKEREAAEADAREQRRLAAVGKNAETYNLAGRIRELEAELSELRKAAPRAS